MGWDSVFKGPYCIILTNALSWKTLWSIYKVSGHRTCKMEPLEEIQPPNWLCLASTVFKNIWNEDTLMGLVWGVQSSLRHGPHYSLLPHNQGLRCFCRLWLMSLDCTSGRLHSSHGHLGGQPMHPTNAALGPSMSEATFQVLPSG